MGASCSLISRKRAREPSLQKNKFTHLGCSLNSRLRVQISETKNVKYFFLSEGWSVARVWASDGLWQITAWRRPPDIQRLNICLVENNELLWLYRVEAAVLTVEVKPITPAIANETIGQVVLKRLMTAEQVIERLGNAETKCQLQNIQLVVQ